MTTWVEQLSRVLFELRLEKTGKHRYSKKCHGCMTGPEDDVHAQLICAIAFSLAFLCWSVVVGFLVASTNVLLSLMPYLTMSAAGGYFIACACVDPGVIPRHSHSSNNTDEECDPPIKEHARYCKSCNIVKPDGAYHCDHCDACVREIDHHCGVIGQCIAGRNKALFLGILYNVQSSLIYCMVNLGLGAFHYTKNQEMQLDSSVAFQIVVWVAGGLELLIFILVGPFWGALELGIGNRGPFRCLHLILFRGHIAVMLKSTIVRFPLQIFPAFGLSRPESLLDWRPIPLTPSEEALTEL